MGLQSVEIGISSEVPTENILYEIPLGMLEKMLANPLTGDGSSHPDLHLIYVDEVCGLFKLASLPEDEVNKKVFPLSLKDKALTWYRLCDDTGSWGYNRLKLEFHQKFYPMHLVHRDRNFIYNFWPRDRESIAQAWGRLKSMRYLLKISYMKFLWVCLRKCWLIL